MKRLLILLLLVACSHEHPLTDHQHDLPVHDHSNLLTLGLPYTYIVSVDPPLSEYNIVPYGYLTKRLDDREIVYMSFNRPVNDLSFDNLEYPHLNTTPVHHGGYEGTSKISRAYVQTDCSDPDHTGYIAFRLGWGDTGSADFIYKCPEE